MLRKLTGSSNRSHDTTKTNMAAIVRTIHIEYFAALLLVPPNFTGLFYNSSRLKGDCSVC